MKMATGLEICDGESDMTAERSDEDKDPNTVEERFRVDRRKLEHMLQAGLDGTGESGERFFQKIMEQTETVITWPSKLKIGAKSKKDPHIKVAGLPISVKLAKDKIMLVLDTKSNRVTLKMDVSHTDHSHIIGKAGGNIKRVMQDTGCHIHFPDSNRGSQAEKSNQVSIAGQPLGVESARRQIRDLLPLVLTFELPIGGHVLPDPNSPPIIHIAQACNVSVSFKQRPRTGTQTVIVRGSQQHVAGLKDAIRRLVELFTGNVASTVQVSTQIDIAPQHHLFIIGKNGTNIKQIMQTTGARIGFPEANCPQRKGTVFITSSVQSVLDARAQLMDCLPLVLMFDLREEDRELSADAEDLNKLMEEFDVFLSVKHKPKQASKSVIVKSCERNAKNMYLARQAILGLDRNENQAVPPPFTRSDFPPCSPINMDEYYGLLAFQTSPINGHCPSPLPSPVATSMTSVTAWLPTNVTPASPTISSLMGGAILPPTNQLLSCPSPPLIGCGSTPPPPPPGLGPPNPDFCASHVMSQYATPSQGSCEQSNGTESPINSPLGQRTSNSVSQRLPSPIGTIGQRTCSPALERQMSSGSSIRLGSSGSSSPRSPRSKSPPLFQDEGGLLGSESSNDLMDSLLANREARSTSFGSGGSTGSLGICQTSRRPVEILSGTKNANLHSSTTSVATDSTDSDSLNSSLSLLDNLLVQKSNLSQDYEQKKEMASKAMKKRVVFSEVRTPTNQWSGLGFSKSMPESAIKELLSSKAKAKGGMLPYNPPFQNSAFQPCTTSFSSMANTTAVRDTRCHSMYEVSPQSRLDAESNECQYGTYSEHLSNRRESVSLENCADLQELFEKLKLTKYWDTFKGEEVDLPTFMTLTEEDLKELGVSAFGARRKMLNAIRVLQFFQEKEPSSKNIEPSSTLSDVAYNPLPFPRRRIDSASQSGRW